MFIFPKFSNKQKVTTRERIAFFLHWLRSLLPKMVRDAFF